VGHVHEANMLSLVSRDHSYNIVSRGRILPNERKLEGSEAEEKA